MWENLPAEDEDIPEDHEIWSLEPGHMWDRKVAHDYTLPLPPRGDRFYLDVLTERHTKSLYPMWRASLEHICRTPGFGGRNRPTPLTSDAFAEDVRRRVADFATRRGFSYVVLDAESHELIGAVSVYPPQGGQFGAHVQSWVSVGSAELDVPLYELVDQWMECEWPFLAFSYARRVSDL